jgi:hypothetical protein
MRVTDFATSAGRSPVPFLVIDDPQRLARFVVVEARVDTHAAVEAVVVAILVDALPSTEGG